MTDSLTKSELIRNIRKRQHWLTNEDVQMAVGSLLDHISESLLEGGRIEVRNFGSLSLRHRAGFVGHNPKTGASVEVPEKYLAHFKPGNLLRDRVNRGASKESK